MSKKLVLLMAGALLLASCSGSRPDDPSSGSASSEEASSSQTSDSSQSSEKATESSSSSKRDESSKEESSSKDESSSKEESESQSSSEAKKKYLITFYDENGEVLSNLQWEEGETPSYQYSVDDKDSQEWDYSFKGWALTSDGQIIEIPAVSEEASYYAIVTKTKKKYTLTFNANGGSSISPITQEYGTQIQEPTKPTKSGYKFVSWAYDTAGDNKVSWPITIEDNLTIYAIWNEKVDIKGYLASLISATGQDPYSYIPKKMLPTNSANHVAQGDVTYDFTSFVNVSDISYGGFGEQWNMVITNIRESQRFYSVLTGAETIINSTVVAFNNYLDNNPSDTATHSIKETGYTASIDFHNGVLTYVLQYKTGWNIPFFGEVLPQIDMTYDVLSKERAVRIQLSENNALRYLVSENKYEFGLEYGVSALNRKAYFEISKDKDENIEGHIYEYVQLKDKDLVPSCADFYINSEYVSVVGNKASGMPGFTGYINELYKADEGKLLGYEVREQISKWGLSATYHTLWFNLCDISGITSIKAVENGSSTFGLGGENSHDIYLNGSSSKFEPTYNYLLVKKTSRKYDVELRKQSFFGYADNELVEYETEIPMMFIQADHDGYTNFSDFPSDILSKSGINAKVALNSKYLTKIQADYATLIDVFIENKGSVSGDAIEAFIGSATEIGE